MSEVRRRRADAERSRESVLESAVRLLQADPDATLEQIATAAGVTRQTLYAHFPSRRALLSGVIERLTEDYLATLDAARLDEGPPIEALARLVVAGMTSMRTWAPLFSTLTASSDPADAERQHSAVLERITCLVLRGQRSGDFDDRLPARWLASATVALSHAAFAEAASGGLRAKEIEPVLFASLAGLYGAGTARL